MLSNFQKTFVLRKLSIAICVLFFLAGPALSATDGQGGIRIRDIVVVEKKGELLVLVLFWARFRQNSWKPSIAV